MRRQLEVLQARVQFLERSLAKQRRLNQALKQSVSWRLTSPFRAFVDAFRQCVFRSASDRKHVPLDEEREDDPLLAHHVAPKTKVEAPRRAPFLRSGGKPHIAVVGHFAGPTFFGAERSLLGILSAIDADRYRMSCILPQASDAYLRAVAQYTTDITVLPYEWWSKSRPINERALEHFERVFRRGGVDAVHVNTITLMEPLHAARRLGLPAAVHVRELIDQDAELAAHFDSEPSEIVETVREAADFIIANSDATLKLYHKGEGRSFRLYNSVDAECFELKLELEPGRLKVGLISNNQPKKGVRDFIGLALAARDTRPDLQFLLIGPHSAYTDRLKEMLREVPPPLPNLDFIGYVATPAEAVARVDVALSLSNFAESFGRTIAEAMAAGRPVIAYERGATAELIRDGVDGYLVPPFDYERALSLLAMLADNPHKLVELGENGRARANELFSPRAFAAGLNDIYGRIIGAGASSASR